MAKHMLDLIGVKVNRLTVIEKYSPYISPNGHKIYRWKCLCECGNTTISETTMILRGTKKSCGCASKDWGESTFVDLVGRTFARLTVVERCNYRDFPDKKNYSHSALWKCLCKCGNYTVATSVSLKSGNTKSCGCLLREKRTTENIIGKTFGNLEVVGVGEPYISPKGKKKFMWKCKCICGNIINCAPSPLKVGRVVSCGCGSESYIASQLKKYFSINYSSISEYRILKNEKTGYYLPYDIYIPKNNAFIEIQGGHHYFFSSWFHKDRLTFEKRKKTDKLKKSFAKKMGSYIEVDLRKIKTVEQAIKYIEQLL